jgi:hypothetical protein
MDCYRMSLSPSDYKECRFGNGLLNRQVLYFILNCKYPCYFGSYVSRFVSVFCLNNDHHLDGFEPSQPHPSDLSLHVKALQDCVGALIAPHSSPSLASLVLSFTSVELCRHFRSSFRSPQFSPPLDLRLLFPPPSPPPPPASSLPFLCRLHVSSVTSLAALPA